MNIADIIVILLVVVIVGGAVAILEEIRKMGKAAVDVTADTAARAVGKRINKAEFEFTWRESK